MAVLEFEVIIRVDYSDKDGLAELQRQTFNNQVAANGTDTVTNITISDLSNDMPENRDTVSDEELRAALDEDGDYDPNEAGENQPTPIVFPAAVQGELWTDTNGNGLRDGAGSTTE